MPTDIEGLTEAELIDLNRRIVHRLRTIQQVRAHGAMMEFSVGDRVVFGADGRRIVGTLTKYNRKTVSILADDGSGWNVSPTLLARLDPADPDFKPRHPHGPPHSPPHSPPHHPDCPNHPGNTRAHTRPGLPGAGGRR